MHLVFVSSFVDSFTERFFSLSFTWSEIIESYFEHFVVILIFQRFNSNIVNVIEFEFGGEAIENRHISLMCVSYVEFINSVKIVKSFRMVIPLKWHFYCHCSSIQYTDTNARNNDRRLWLKQSILLAYFKPRVMVC